MSVPSGTVFPIESLMPVNRIVPIWPPRTSDAIPSRNSTGWAGLHTYGITSGAYCPDYWAWNNWNTSRKPPLAETEVAQPGDRILMGESFGSGDVRYIAVTPIHQGGANFGFFDGHARWSKVKLADPKCKPNGSGNCAADIDPDPHFSMWRYREADPILK